MQEFIVFTVSEGHDLMLIILLLFFIQPFPLLLMCLCHSKPLHTPKQHPSLTLTNRTPHLPGIQMQSHCVSRIRGKRDSISQDIIGINHESGCSGRCIIATVSHDRNILAYVCVSVCVCVCVRERERDVETSGGLIQG